MKIENHIIAPSAVRTVDFNGMLQSPIADNAQIEFFIVQELFIRAEIA